MLKVIHRTVAPVIATALLSLGAPAMALSAEAEAAFEAEIREARSNMMAHSDRALDHARKAAKVASGETAKAWQAKLTAQWLEAEALMRLNQHGDASPIINAALEQTASRFAGSKLHADLLRSHGSLSARNGQFAAALGSFQQAQDIFAALGEDRSRAIVLQNIGSVYSGANEFERALEYYRQSEQVFAGDPALSLSAHNNIGNALKGLGRYEEAAARFAAALELAKAKSSPLLEARILTNVAAAQVLGGKLDQGEETAHKAMAIAAEHAPGWMRFIEGVLAQVEFQRGQDGEAQKRIEAAFAGEDLTKTAADFREFHETAVEIYGRAGNAMAVANHRAAIERLNAQVARIAG